MAKMKRWCDGDGDYLELRTEETMGHMKDVREDILRRVNQNGKVIGFGILGFKKRLNAI